MYLIVILKCLSCSLAAIISKGRSDWLRARPARVPSLYPQRMPSLYPQRMPIPQPTDATRPASRAGIKVNDIILTINGDGCGRVSCSLTHSRAHLLALMNSHSLPHCSHSLASQASFHHAACGEAPQEHRHCRHRHLPVALRGEHFRPEMEHMGRPGSCVSVPTAPKTEPTRPPATPPVPARRC